MFVLQEIPISPFRVKVNPSHDAGNVRAEGTGLNKTGVEAGTPTHFTIFTKGAGKAKLKVQFTAAELKGEAVRDFEIIDNHDYSYTVKYTAVQQGQMTISVTHGGDPIPKSPFIITVAPPIDLGKVKVTGLDTSKFSTLYTVTLQRKAQNVIDLKTGSCYLIHFLLLGTMYI